MNEVFCITEVVVDGVIYKAGEVVSFDFPGYSAATILGFSKEGNVRVARPYVYAASIGTTAPTALCGVEIVDHAASRLAGKKLPADAGTWVKS